MTDFESFIESKMNIEIEPNPTPREAIDYTAVKISNEIGPVYAVSKIDDYKGENREKVLNIIANIKKMVLGGFSFLFQGKRGTGKTLASALIYRACAEAGYWVRYTTAQDFLLSIFDNDQDTVDKAKKCKLLIMDEIGKTTGSEKSGWELARVLNVLEHRDRMQKSTILISNLHMDDIGKYIGLDMIDRMNGPLWKKIKWAEESRRGK